jgi:hypothetical protein
MGSFTPVSRNGYPLVKLHFTILTLHYKYILLALGSTIDNMLSNQ